VQRTTNYDDTVTASEDDASHISIQLGLRLREYYPQTVEIDAESRLGRVLGRLTAALDAAAASAVAPAFKDELLVVVPRLRRDVPDPRPDRGR
jgi:hypothetical protein